MGKKIDALQLLTSGGIDQSSDLVVVFDSTTQTAKKMTVVDFLSLAQSSLDIGSLTILTGANIDVVDDYLVIRSDADGQLYKVSPKELFTKYTIADLQNLNANQVDQNQDHIGIWDASANVYHKISVSALLSLVPSTALTHFAEAGTSSYVSLSAVSNQTNSSIVLVPKGSGALQLRTSGNTRGSLAVDLQMFDSGSFEVAGGNFSTITGGIFNAITANGVNARAGGRGAVADQYGADAWAGGSVNNNADGCNQFMRIIMRNRTTSGSTSFDLFSSVSDSIKPTLRFSGTHWYALIHVIIRCQSQGDGTVNAGDIFAHSYKCVIKRVGTTTSIVGSVQQIGTSIADTAMNNATVAITADDANDNLKIVVTVPNGGTNGQFIATANVEITQVL